jgi:hypothetical protein
MKYFLWLLLLAFSASAIAQEDDLPPPSPKVKKNDGEWKPVDSPDKTEKKEEFKPFNKKKKLDLSKFIIEPNFNFSIGNNVINLGLSPYVGYRIWQPKNVKPGSMQGLYAGAGITYFYTRFSNIEYLVSNGSRVYGNANYHTFGGGVFLQYNIWKGFFARAKFEALHRVMDDIEGYQPVYGNPPNNNTIIGVRYPKIQKTVPALLVGVGYNLLQSKNFFMPIMVSYNVLHSVVDRNYSLYPRGVVVQLGFINLF